MVKHCPKCMYPSSHPLGLYLVGETCSGCLTHEEKYSLDWNCRERTLYDFIKKIKKSTRSYDCVVPVIGDAEDFYVVNKVLQLGLNPLIVSVNDYFKNDIGWKNLHQLISHFDVDSIFYNPNISCYKELVRTSLRKFDHILLPFLQLHSSFPVHIAKDRNIPLIIWGQNQSIEQVGKFSHVDCVEMSRWSRRQHDLFGVEVDTLIGNGAQVDPLDLNYYHYPGIKDIYRSGVRGIYLSNYYPWDPLRQNHSTIDFGFQPQVNELSFDIYERAGSSVYYSFHDLLKRKRVGYGKIVDHVAREIRHGRITKSEGIALIQKYGNIQIDIKPFFNWLGVSKSGYDWFIKHRLDSVRCHVGSNQSEAQSIEIPYQVNKLLREAGIPEDEFLLMSKGIEI